MRLGIIRLRKTPNPLPLRRAVTDILQQSDDASGLVENPKSESRYGDHSLQVCRLSLLLAQGAKLSEEKLQILGLPQCSMIWDMQQEKALIPKGEEGFPPPFERHSAAGARMLLRQRGFHQAKLNAFLPLLNIIVIIIVRVESLICLRV